MNIQHAFHHVVHTKPITEYLEKLGRSPLRTNVSRIFYSCPMPDHKETRPSFVVYTGGEFENYYCFGCQSGYTIVDLVAGVEGLSWKDALQKLSEGVEFNLEQNTDFSIGNAEKKQKSHLGTHQDVDLEQDCLSIATLGRGYLESIQYDPGEMMRVDTLYAHVDNMLHNLDFEKIHSYSKYLPDVLNRRRDKFEEMKIEQARHAE